MVSIRYRLERVQHERLDDLYHFVIAVWRPKDAKSARMKHWQIALSIFAALSASLVLAEDFKTINGKEFKGATVTRVEGDGIVLRTKTGISKVYFVELPQDVQKKFRPTPATPSAAQREREAIETKAKQDGRRQGDRAGRILVLGQNAVSWKIIGGGIVVLLVVVLAVVRRRS